MSRQSGIQVDRSAKTVARLRSGAVQKPLVKESLNLLIARLGMTPLEILAHQIEPGLEEIERRPERVGYRLRSTMV